MTGVEMAIAAKAFVLAYVLAYGPHDDSHGSLPGVCRHCGCRKRPDGRCKNCDSARETTDDGE
jgi:hypothetical protein